MVIKRRLAFFLPVLVALPLTTSSRVRFRVIEAGEFHGDEINARSGEYWLGLFVRGRRTTLRYSRISVSRVFDDVTDYGTGRKTGKRVGVNSSTTPLLLISPATALSPGPVITVFQNEPEPFNRGLEKFSTTLRLNHRQYVLKVVAPDKAARMCPDNGFPENARLVLTSRRSEQVLYTLDECGNEPIWYLVWAGDLDHDGKLDLYVNVTQHYDISERRLFLSSHARKGRLVREVASFVTGGC